MFFGKLNLFRVFIKTEKVNRSNSERTFRPIKCRLKIRKGRSGAIQNRPLFENKDRIRR
jgi:hypothetical protein